MLKKALCGTMAIGIAALLSLPELAIALPQQSKQTSIQQNQLELVKKRRAKKKKSRRSRRPAHHTQFQPQPVHQMLQHLA